MMHQLYGYFGVILDINLTTGRIEKKTLPSKDIDQFIGGRGLGAKILWDRLKTPGIQATSAENPLIFLPGPFSGFPIASASRTCVVTKSPCTSPHESSYAHASTISYSNFGGFFGPEIKFAGYDGIVLTGTAASPVYLLIDDDRVEIRDASSYWGMGTDAFDKQFSNDLGDRHFRTCYIGPAGENMVPYASIMHTSARAAGRGVGCVMGSKKLKAIAVKGTRLPEVAAHQQLLDEMAKSRNYFKGLSRGKILSYLFRNKGTAFLIEKKSKKGAMAVKNFREGTFLHAQKIGAAAANKRLWSRNFACYCCPLACKKSGVVKQGPYAGLVVHDGPEYETGTMLGANLMIPDLALIMKSIYDCDDYGLDIISAGNVIGFLMEAYEKGYVHRDELDGIDLKWGHGEAVLSMLEKIGKREGVGDLASQGVKKLCATFGNGTEPFAMHVKGMEIAAHNVHVNHAKGICYATSNRGACHQNGETIEEQHLRAVIDSLGICRFACTTPLGLSINKLAGLLSSITGVAWTDSDLLTVGERIFNLEKMFNYREGFRRIDDNLPDRFFEEPLTVGKQKGSILDRLEFKHMMDQFYHQREWDSSTTKPKTSKLKALSLNFTCMPVV